MAQFILHVGVMKSGTTYLQSILAKNRSFLMENGWHYPGKRLNQQHACYGLCGNDIHWVQSGEQWAGTAERLKEKIRASETNILVSAEALSVLDHAGVKRFIDHVGTPSKIVFTIRPLHQLIPSAWQQLIKGGHSVPFERFIEDWFLSERENDAAPMIRTYAYGRSVQRWAEISGAPVEVVETLSSGAPDALWDQFRRVCGLPNVPDRTVPPLQENKSISREAADLLVHVNALLRDRPDAERLRKAYLGEILFPLTDERVGRKPTLPAEHAAVINDWNDQEMELLKKHAILHTIGDTSTRSAPLADHPEADNAPTVLAHQIVRMLPHVIVSEPQRIP